MRSNPFLMILTIAAGILVFSSCATLAADYGFKLVTNQNALEAELDLNVDVSDSRLIAGISGLYDNDDYKLLSVKAMVSDEVLLEGLTAGLGLKGIWGDAEKRHFDADVLNAGFACYVGYDLSKSGLNKVPVTLSAGFFMSPEPLAFEDTEELIEVTAEGTWKVLEQAAIVVSYRYIEIDFEPRPKSQKCDSAGYLGLRFFF